MIQPATKPSPTLLIVGSSEDFSSQVQEFLSSFSVQEVNHLPEAYHRQDYGVIIFSPNCYPQKSINSLQEPFFYLSFSPLIVGDIQILSPYSFEQFQAALNAALKYHATNVNLKTVSRKHTIVSKDRANLSAIGIALSAEKDLEKLLGMVLNEGRKLAKCEGASLYLIEKNKQGEDELVFKLTQNSKIFFDFEESRFPLNNDSLAGYVALNGLALNIDDAYKLDQNVPYSFDKSYDRQTDYRTKEMLVLPMLNHKGKIIGVLQFVNTFGGATKTNKNKSANLQGFSKIKQGLLSGLASQAAVAIDNSQLIENIKNLFEGFVAASVSAIESRDPATSGHSFRVAKLTTGLAQMVDKETSGPYKNRFFNQEQLTELRYASLLHDFGKVGVKENVLLKANKLHASRYQYLMLKIAWQKQILEKRFYLSLIAEKVDLTHQISVEQAGMINIKNFNLQGNKHYSRLIKQIDRLEYFEQLLAKANQPAIIEQTIEKELKQMMDYSMDKDYPFNHYLISDSDFLSLSISKGSLTEKERREIQSHVTYTQSFLEKNTLDG
ncbi:MAG: GAF domain-containing protein [Enterobacterales bacterium]|nr:GAF domain-containing protein [Enterobacterales bacterium]